jgi:hypothetical protein
LKKIAERTNPSSIGNWDALQPPLSPVTSLLHLLFEVAAATKLGNSMLYVVANGIPSVGTAVNIPTNWSVVGVADFNGDGLGDILWRDTAGDYAVWLMIGATVTSEAGLGNVPGAWPAPVTSTATAWLMFCAPAAMSRSGS